MSDQMVVQDAQIEEAVANFRDYAVKFENAVLVAKGDLDKISWDDANGTELANKAKETFEIELPKVVDSLHKCSALCDSILQESQAVQGHIASRAAELG